VPFLDAWGKPLLFGPGSILVAHTDAEHVSIDELETSAEAYQSLARQLLAR
jgi:acetylornithine deacetylase